MSKKNKNKAQEAVEQDKEAVETVEEVEEVESPIAEEDSPTEDLEMVAEEANLIEEWRQKLDELEDSNLRLSAEFDNFRKRSRKEKEQCYTNAKVDLVKSFLPLLDGLDRAYETYSKQESDEAKANLEGMALLIKQGQDCLAAIGVEEIVCEDATFDPELHEAVQHVEDEGYPQNAIIEVLLKGYKAGDTVIRHSVVRVAN